MNNKLLTTLLMTVCLLPLTLYAQTYTQSASSDLIGEPQTIELSSKDSLTSIARKYNVAYQELRYANPKFNAKKTTSAVLPSQFILPPQVGDGIVVNLAEFRLYYKIPGTETIISAPISMGKMGWQTPLRDTTVERKEKDPAWVVPPNIQAEEAREGHAVRTFVAAGPKNPLGAYALKLALPGYLIHGTDQPSSIGKRVSHGCIRMYPEDIDVLFHAVPVDTPVHIVHEPILVGWNDGKLYLEVHHSHTEYKKDSKTSHNLAHGIVQRALSLHPGYKVDWDKVDMIVDDAQGLPVSVN